MTDYLFSQMCFPLIDTILDTLSPGEHWDYFCDLTYGSDVVGCTDRQTFEVKIFIRFLKQVVIT